MKKYKQRGDTDLLGYVIIFGVAFAAWTVLGGLWHLFSTLPSQRRQAAQATLAKSLNIPTATYIKNMCKIKATCARYEDARDECAEAGSIRECIKIKMKGEDYSVCEDDDMAETLSSQSEITPTHFQCVASKINNLF